MKPTKKEIIEYLKKQYIHATKQNAVYMEAFYDLLLSKPLYTGDMERELRVANKYSDEASIYEKILYYVDTGEAPLDILETNTDDYEERSAKPYYEEFMLKEE